MEYRFLTPDDQPQIYKTLVTAFADYPVRSQPTPQQLHALMVRRGVSYEHSVGVFEDDTMVAVQATGVGPWQGETAAYDVFTGVVAAHRGKRLAGGMLEYARPALRESGCHHMYLEVLQTNTSAIKAYKRVGFEEIRDLVCFEMLKSQVRGNEGAGVAEVVRLDRPDWPSFETFGAGVPSWQNSRASIERSIDPVLYLGAIVGKKCVGYAVCAPGSRDLFQLGVDANYRRRGIGRQLITAIAKEMKTEEIRILNIDARADADLAFYPACGARETLRQFEMVLEL